MATSTTNLNLSKPAYTDPADIAVINDNMDKLDGAVNGVEDGLAIVANGNTHAAVAAGQFVYVRNHSSLAQGVYKATTAIAANGALSTSNLTADASGGLNALKADIDTLNSNYNIKLVQSGLLNEALTLPTQTQRAYLLGSYTDTDVPSAYYTAVAVAYRRYNSSLYVILYCATLDPIINFYNGTSWSGWRTFYASNNWKQLVSETIPANTAYDQTLSHEDISNYNEIMFVIIRQSNGRTFASSVAPVSLFISAGLYANGAFAIYSGKPADFNNTWVNGVAIFISSTQTEMAINAIPESVIARIYVR